MYNIKNDFENIEQVIRQKKIEKFDKQNIDKTRF